MGKGGCSARPCPEIPTILMMMMMTKMVLNISSSLEQFRSQKRKLKLGIVSSELL